MITKVQELPTGWVFYYDSVDYVETGDLRRAFIGNGPLFVGREDGSWIWTGTGEPVEYYVEQWQRRRAWRRSAPIGDVLASDALEELALRGPEMKVPVGDRLGHVAPNVDEASIEGGVECATHVGELALALTEDAGPANDPILWRVAQLEASGGVAEPTPDVRDCGATGCAVPEPLPTCPVRRCARARYWWRWESKRASEPALGRALRAVLCVPRTAGVMGWSRLRCRGGRCTCRPAGPRRVRERFRLLVLRAVRARLRCSRALGSPGARRADRSRGHRRRL